MTTYAVTSEIIAAPTILAVDVVRTDLGDWEPEPDSNMLRSAGTVTVALTEVLQGEVPEATGDTAEVEVVIYGSGSGRLGDYQGLWTHVPTAPGTRLVAFSDATASTLACALTDEHCHWLTEAEAVLDDARLTAGLHRRDLSAGALLDEAEQRRTGARDVFARYVWVASRDVLRADADGFERLMRVAEDPETRIEAQAEYLLSAYEDMTFTGEFPDLHRARLARAMMRSALDPHLGELRTHLLRTFVPNLVGAPVPRPLSVEDVFADAAGLPTDSELHEAVRAELDDPRESATDSPELSSWLPPGSRSTGSQ